MHWLLPLLLSVASPAVAQEDEEFAEEDAEYSQVSFGVSGDSYDSRTYLLDASVFITDTVKAVGGVSTVKGGEAEQISADYNSAAFYLGVSAPLTGQIEGSLSYDHWGQRSSLISRGLIGSLAYQWNDWSFSLNGGVHRIHYRTGGAKKDSTAPHLGAGAGFQGWAPFAFYVGYTKYRYGDDILALDDDEELVPAAVLSQSSSFVSEESSAGVVYSFLAHSIAAEASRSTSVLYPARVTNLTLRLSLTLTDTWGLDLEGGRSKTESETPEKSSYWGAAASYYW